MGVVGVKMLPHLSSEELTGGGVASEGSLDGLDLHGDSREHGLLQSVELIKTAPRPTLDDPNEDTTHTLHINTLMIYMYMNISDSLAYIRIHLHVIYTCMYVHT